MPRPRRLGLIGLVTVICLAITGCGSEESGASDEPAKPKASATEASPTDQASPSTKPAKKPSGVTINITFKGDTVDPNGCEKKVKAGKPIKLHIVADAPGELHVHSSPEQEIEYPPGTTDKTLEIDQPGVVEVESHHLDTADRAARGALSDAARARGRGTSCPAPPARAGRCQGPADPAGAGCRGRHGSTDRLLLRAGPGLAHAPLPGRPARAPGSAVARAGWWTARGSQWTVRVVGLLFFGYLIWALIWGPDLVNNPALGTFYVLVWVGVVPASLLLGPVVRAVSPVRTINLLLAKATGGDAATGLVSYPARLGYWPAAAGLFAFVWQELVNPQSAYLGSVRIWLAAYLAIMLVGAAVFGDEWLERADPFEVYSSLLAKLSPWGRDGDRLVDAQSAGQPGDGGPATGTRRRRRRAVGLDGVRQLQGHDRLAAVRPGRRR